MARATMNISLPHDLRAFIEAEVMRGGYGTTSEYIRALVRQARARAGRPERSSTPLPQPRSGRIRGGPTT